MYLLLFSTDLYHLIYDQVHAILIIVMTFIDLGICKHLNAKIPKYDGSLIRDPLSVFNKYCSKTVLEIIFPYKLH